MTSCGASNSVTPPSETFTGNTGFPDRIRLRSSQNPPARRTTPQSTAPSAATRRAGTRSRSRDAAQAARTTANAETPYHFVPSASPRPTPASTSSARLPVLRWRTTNSSPATNVAYMTTSGTTPPSADRATIGSPVAAAANTTAVERAAPSSRASAQTPSPVSASHGTNTNRASPRSWKGSTASSDRTSPLLG